MAVNDYVVCDGCAKIITRPEDGFMIKGNIWAADPGENRALLVGNNFPETRNFAVTLSEIGESHLCTNCMVRSLGLKQEFMTTHVDKRLARSA